MANTKAMNILMIMTDQQHKFALGAVTPYVKTPNLDKLAEEGTLFTDCYSNNPICSPFRALIYSGRYSKDTGAMGNECVLRPGEITLAHELSKIGYETSFVGKLHLGATGNQAIPEEFRVGHKHFLGYQCYNGFLDNINFYDENNVKHTYTGHRTDITTDLGIERLQMLASLNKPFLHTVFYQAPHYPEEPLPKYEELYSDFTFPMAEEFSYIEPYTPTHSPKSPRPVENCKNYQRYGGNFQMYLKLYYSMVSQIDANIGRILDELETLGIKDNTAIIFSSDHGDMQGSHGMVNKCLPFQRSCAVPLIVKIPNVKQAKTIDNPVSSVDFYPTCMELANTKSIKDLAGTSLVSLIKGEKSTHPPVYAENISLKHMKWKMLRDDRYKLVLDYATNEAIYLFDMKNDSIEANNLIENPDYLSIINEMTDKLLAI